MTHTEAQTIVHNRYTIQLTVEEQGWMTAVVLTPASTSYTVVLTPSTSYTLALTPSIGYTVVLTPSTSYRVVLTPSTSYSVDPIHQLQC